MSDNNLEAMIIGIALSSESDFMEYFDCKLTSGHFSTPIFKRVWDCLSKHWRDLVTLCNSEKDIADSYALLADAVVNSGSTTQHKYQSELLKSRSRVIKVSAACLDAVKQFGSGSDIESMLAYLSSAQNDYDDSSGVEHIDYSLKFCVDQMDHRFKNKDSDLGLKIGIDRFDSRSGGLRSGDLWVVGARPSMGKTALMMSVIKNHMAKKDSNSLIFSLEMPKHQLTDRLISSAGRIDSMRIRDGDLQDDDWNNLTVALSKIKGKDVFIDDTAGIDIDTLALRAKSHHRKKPLTFLAIDYLQLLRMRGASKEYEVVSECSRRLKELAKELECPVMLLSQLNRECESRTDKRPILRDLRASGSIEQDADIITFLYRDEVYDENTQDKGIMELITAKFRNGSPGIDKAAANMKYTSIDNLIATY